MEEQTCADCKYCEPIADVYCLLLGERRKAMDKACKDYEPQADDGDVRSGAGGVEKTT